jgi:hypothetical protein
MNRGCISTLDVFLHIALSDDRLIFISPLFRPISPLSAAAAVINIVQKCSPLNDFLCQMYSIQCEMTAQAATTIDLGTIVSHPSDRPTCVPPF